MYGDYVLYYSIFSLDLFITNEIISPVASDKAMNPEEAHSGISIKSYNNISKPTKTQYSNKDVL